MLILIFQILNMKHLIISDELDESMYHFNDTFDDMEEGFKEIELE